MARRLVAGQTVIIASHNPGKVAELDALLSPAGIRVVSVGALGLQEPEETEPDFAGNARLKALAAARGGGHPALSDDSGFCVAALGGEPGVLSARWAGPDKDFAGAMARVESLLDGADDRRAWFVCALSVGWPDGHADTFVGRVDGHVTFPPRGALGFGYDPIFVPLGRDQTFGEMSRDEKQVVSHRAVAFRQFVAACLPGVIVSTP
jgi:XTP/dITP diphosphohydrolase